MKLNREVVVHLSVQDKEYIGDMIEWAFACGLTFDLRTYAQFSGTGKNLKKKAKFKILVQEVAGNQWKKEEFEAETVAEVRHKMGKFMHETWDRKFPENDRDKEAPEFETTISSEGIVQHTVKTVIEDSQIDFVKDLEEEDDFDDDLL